MCSDPEDKWSPSCDGSNRGGTKVGDRIIRENGGSHGKHRKEEDDSGLIDFLTATTILLDNVGVIVSMGEAAVADIFIIGLAAIAIAQPEAEPLALGIAAYADYQIASFGGIIENTAGGLSLLSTSAVDVLSR